MSSPSWKRIVYSNKCVFSFNHGDDNSCSNDVAKNDHGLEHTADNGFSFDVTESKHRLDN